jgi:hypothetical protein
VAHIDLLSGGRRLRQDVDAPIDFIAGAKAALR